MTPFDVAVSVQGYLADGGNSPSDIDPTTGKGPEWGEAAPVGLLVLVLLCIAVYFLVKSMNRNLKKVPDSFAPEPLVTAGAAAAPTEGGESLSDSAASSSGGSDVTAVRPPDTAVRPPDTAAGSGTDAAAPPESR